MLFWKFGDVVILRADFRAMAQLSALQSLSSASCFAGKWQKSASVSVKVIVLPLRLHTRMISSRLEYLSPKEQHHLRKKEEQKVVRKIRKERRAKRQEEELAKIPRVKPNPAMRRFDRPLVNWNKPWRKKKAFASNIQTGEPHQGFEERKRWVLREDPKLETSSSGGTDANSELSESVRIAWSAFDAIYEEKRKKAADAIPDEKLYDSSVRSNGKFEAAESPGQRAEFRAEYEESYIEANTVQEERDREAWRRPGGTGDRTQEGNVEKTNADQHLEFARARNAEFIDGDNSEEMQQSSKVVTQSVVRASSLSTSFTSRHPVLKRQGREEIETSKYYSKRDSQFNETVNRGSWGRSENSSSDLQMFSKEQKNADGNASVREVTKVLIGQRNGKDVYLSTEDDDAIITKALPRSDLDEEKQLQWLAKQLHTEARPDGVHFSRLMRSGGLKITDSRAIILVQKLGELGNWRCAVQVVEWLDTRNHFPPVKNRYLFTTLLAVLGKARRPIESLNIFNVMREHVATYPDMPAYHIIAVTLGQSGCMEELFELMQSLRQGPDNDSKYLQMVDKCRLKPDIVVYNAALNACVAHRHWRCALWIMDQLDNEKDVWPSSASYGLAIEVMIRAEKFDLAWKLLGNMELGGFHPNSSTYKALVEGLGQMGKGDLAVEMVKQMEERGIVPVSGVYYALATTLCMCGKWKDALLQVDRIVSLSKRPIVETYTGLLKACKEAGHWRDAISVFEQMQQVCAPNIGTYNIMISVYGANKMYEEAKKLFDQIKTGRISSPKLYKSDPRLSPDVFTYNAMLGCCTVSEKWEDLEVLFRQMLLQGLQLNCKQHTWIVKALSEAGKDDLVAAMFNHLRQLNAATSELYVLMITSCLRGGDHDMAFSLLEEMGKEDMRIILSDKLKFHEVAFLLSDEDRLNFTKKMEDLQIASDFNFNKNGRLPSFTEKKNVVEVPKTTDTLSRILNNSKGVNGEELVERNLHSSSKNLYLGNSHERAGDEVQSLAGFYYRPDGFRDDQSQLGDLKTSSGSPGWELLWRRCKPIQHNSKEFQVQS